MSSASSTVPIVRHGEKPDAPDADAPGDGVGLSTQGYEHAAAQRVRPRPAHRRSRGLMSGFRDDRGSKPCVVADDMQLPSCAGPGCRTRSEWKQR